MNENFKKLAKLLCGHSVKVQKGEHVFLDLSETPDDMAEALIEEISARGASAHLRLTSPRVSRKLSLLASQEQLDTDADALLYTLKKMHCYIAVRGSNNIFENSDISAEQMRRISTAMRPVNDFRVNKLKWVVLRWPTAAFAQQARMSTEAFEDFYFKVCTYDYSRFDEGMNALKALMDKTDKVRIKGPGTDLSFSIKGLNAITCGGQYNIPDGEVFTAPVKDSVNGKITYNAPTIYNGISFDGITLEFKDGKIISAKASGNTEELVKILDTDDGARYIGEFSLGFNPLITTPMRDILFDEKIAGSLHFTPGQAYVEADNGNISKIHWDLVCIQTPEYGGGEVWFDDVLIRKDGEFVVSGPDKLNRDFLLK